MCQRFEYFEQTKWLLAVLLICLIGISACSSSSDLSPAVNEPGPIPPLSTIPTMPGNLSFSVYSSHEAELFWTPSTDDGRVMGYDIFRDGVLVQELLDANSFFEDLLIPSTTYHYRVVAVDDDGNQSLPAELTLTTDSNGGVVEPGLNTGDIITVDNHIELLRYVFDILTGEVYGTDMLLLPGYPDPAYDDFAATGDSEIETTTCINGGAATFTPYYFAHPLGVVTAGWKFEFDNCQYDANVFSGMVDRYNVDNGSRIDLISTGLIIDSQSGSTSFSGLVNYNPSGSRESSTRIYDVDDVDYSITNGVEPFELMDATFGMTVTPNGIAMRGKFSILSVATNGQRLDVQASLSYNIFDCGDHVCGDTAGQGDHEFFQEGVLQVTAENGDSLMLETATGDHTTVSIEFTSDDVTETIVQPWSIWRENIKFNWYLLNRTIRAIQ